MKSGTAAKVLLTILLLVTVGGLRARGATLAHPFPQQSAR